jgi:hypothetical protein
MGPPDADVERVTEAGQLAITFAMLVCGVQAPFIVLYHVEELTTAVPVLLLPVHV